MGKASKKGLSRFYFIEDGQRTIRSINAESYDTARQKVVELLGHESFRLGQLPSAESHESARQLEKLSEGLAEELFGGSSVKNTMKATHEAGL